MKKIIVIVLSLFGLIHLSDGVLSQFGQCNELNQAEDFDIDAFLGQWIETWRTGNPGEGRDCSTLYVIEEEADNHVITNTAVNSNFAVEQIGDIQSITNGTVEVVFRGTTEPVKFIVLETGDYSIYSILYTCVDTSPNTRSLDIHVFLRPGIPITSIMTSMLNVSLSEGLNVFLTDLTLIDHTDDACYALPVIDSGPIILPGLCDNPTAYANFAPSQFVGDWHQIAGYYSENNIGACARSKYSMDNGGVTVKNTQVANKTLHTTSGSATVVSDDNSGIIRITLEVLPGVFETQDIWILDTDYANYAISYACIDLPETEEKRVYSWILGRSTDLPEGAQTAVTSVINSRIDLNQKYFQDTLRTDDDCFYFPEPDDKPVVFRGICDESIQVMAGFQLEPFMGLWHSIESYPSQFQTGACVTADYALGEDGVVVLNSQVKNEKLMTASGYAVASDLEPGKLVVSFPIEGTNLTAEADYWVLDTDYNTYALVYSCTNLENRERSVASWKLSRSKNLTSDAAANIEAAMAGILVLDQKYFIDEDQTELACFYYPDPIPGVPVVFPGQCDNDIKTQDDFDLSQFVGTWYEVESYPISQNAQCINHEYSAGPENTFTLVSTQIVDQFMNVNNATVTSDPDDSAKLTIYFTSNGEPYRIPIWILSTDYENYALAYSCIQRNSYFRSIFSWKLSRQTNLTEEAHAAINTAIDPVTVLNNTYFEPIDHSLDGCFYLPELDPGVPVVLLGQCDQNINVIQNFRPDLYSGTWRVISTYPAEFQTGTCLDSTYTPDGATIEVHNTQVVNEELDTITGTAVLAAGDTSGKLVVQFPGVTESADYWILDTDYLSYSLVYSCRDISSTQRRVISWKLSRTDYLTDTANDKINNIIDNVQVLHNRFYEEVNRTRDACFYYPVPDGNPVVFRGQCEDIPVMQGFNAINYEGLWHNIESFPSLNQPGECNNARYTLDDEAIIVFNTEVINQTLSAISGVAWSPYEPAKFIVNFPSVGQETTDYWILDTDYTSYSLVYTCINDGPYYRRVWSWKLSRTRELLPDAAETINNVKKDIKVLDEKYYVPKDQSPDACFYFPEPVLGQPVIFPGQCDQNITTMSNFNISAFLGRWREIKAYPTGQYQGSCISHTFTNGGIGDNINVMSNRVFDLTLNTVNSVLTETGVDGQLSLTITTPTGQVILPFWIIDTDYDDYALAYSCVGNNDDTRNVQSLLLCQVNVYSWKLSRHRDLSSNGENEINTAISDIDVLQNKYYESVDHSDDACFYLPELEPGRPVIFPGQCDATIDVVPNFNVLDFIGQWRLISSYPSEFQVGTCNDAYYHHFPDGTIEVYNTEVVNQTLSTINGTAELTGNGKLRVTFPTAPEPIELWVLDTDYSEYSLLYSCVNINLEQRQVWSWKVGRSDSLSNSSMQAIDDMIGTIDVLNHKYFASIGRTEDDCFYFPEPSEHPVYFRGQCDQNIPVVQNFRADLYQGSWYAVQSYPMEFQFGTCPKALYSYNEDTGIIDVFNTQVYNERLDSINATAVSASDIGDAMLNVTFPFDGYEIFLPYWVLATDYDNYALVYSCINVNDEYMRVGSWKMSKQPNLSGASNSAIDDAMRDIRVVDQRYFLTWDNDEDDCFYYPELTDGRVILPGQCADNNITVVEDFSANDFAGVWYESARFPSEFQNGECAASRFQLSGSTYTLTKTIVYNERLTTMTGLATYPDDGIISANIDDGSGNSFNLNMYILATNYTSFALVYSCRDIGNSSKQIFSWKLSRYRDGLTQEDLIKIDETVQSNRDLFQDYYQYTDHSNDACFYYPRFSDLPDSIELPGPCDNRIRGVPSFNLNAYSGRWFEIARYPAPEQIGTCSRAYYNYLSVNSAVLNTEVFNNTLRSIYGAATVVSADGSGELAITFTIEDEARTASLYVIATDYTSYALAYSCQNLENGNRIVSSWTLSRTSTLGSEGNLVIGQAILNTQGLIDEYYLPTSQSDEDCFYIPEVNQEQAPLFRGQCEDYVRLQNFDIQRFLGLWHEIESYPRDSSAGDCVSSSYDSSNNQIHVLDTGIFDVTAQLTTGTVTADVNGRLTRIMNNGSSTYRQDIVVIATDYDNYAFLYSCEDYNDEYRRVWSAKYSRSRSGGFSAEAQNVMDQLIDDNDLLYPQFYQEVDQSGEACFHYPEQTGQQIILPGQCDENIPVQTNFDTVEYSGIWYQIERYPQPHESGTCIGARYTVNENTEVMTILKWEVIDDELETIGGNAVLYNSNDGSAKMQVSLLIPGTEETVDTDLYILSTDYINYSLAYSCTNINPHQRAVGAWKLSRTRTMPSTATDAINALIAVRDELHQPYFISVEHDEYCKEPSSSTLIRSSIIVTFLCLALKMLL